MVYFSDKRASLYCSFAVMKAEYLLVEVLNEELSQLSNSAVYRNQGVPKSKSLSVKIHLHQ